MKNLMKRAGIALVLCTLMVLSITTFAQNVFPVPHNPESFSLYTEQQPVAIPVTKPASDQTIIINNNPPQIQPAQPRPIYSPSRRRIEPPAPAKRDTVVIVQPIQQSSFLSENGIIWCIIVLGLLLFGILGYLIAGGRRYGNCCGYRGLCNGSCGGCNRGSGNINHQGHIDHGHSGMPTKVTHIHTHVHSGIPTEILMKAEIPVDSNKAEPRPSANPSVDEQHKNTQTA